METCRVSTLAASASQLQLTTLCALIYRIKKTRWPWVTQPSVVSGRRPATSGHWQLAHAHGM